MMSARRKLITDFPVSSDGDHRVLRFHPRRAKATGTGGFREPALAEPTLREPMLREPMPREAIHREPMLPRDANILLVESFAKYEPVKYEQKREDDDYRHRMIMNGLAAAVSGALIVAGVWLVDMIRG